MTTPDDSQEWVEGRLGFERFVALADALSARAMGSSLVYDINAAGGPVHVVDDSMRQLCNDIAALMNSWTEDQREMAVMAGLIPTPCR